MRREFLRSGRIPAVDRIVADIGIEVGSTIIARPARGRMQILLRAVLSSHHSSDGILILIRSIILESAAETDRPTLCPLRFLALVLRREVGVSVMLVIVGVMMFIGRDDQEHVDRPEANAAFGANLIGEGADG